SHLVLCSWQSDKARSDRDRPFNCSRRTDFRCQFIFGSPSAARLAAWHVTGALGLPRACWRRLFPWGTLLVNITGSLIIGFFATLTGPDGRIFASSTVRQFVMIGLCGGYTTFSSFSLQTLSLTNDGEWLQAGGNIIGSVVLCLLAVW